MQLGVSAIIIMLLLLLKEEEQYLRMNFDLNCFLFVLNTSSLPLATEE